jgi:quercetin dioxygenase-like cupin family protein
MVEKIKLIGRGANVQPLYWALMTNPQVWNKQTIRTEHPKSPHYKLDDIWIRYGDEERCIDQKPHMPHWYPEADVLGIKPLLRDLVRQVDGDILGGVLITRIPAGATCKPHVDDGWHAKFYEKYAIQIASAPGQKFCFEGQELETAPGDVFWFNNQHLHWVENPTPHERITLIACIK